MNNMDRIMRFAALDNLADKLLAAMPERERSHLDALVQRTSGLLGESPEAWRGMVILGLEFINGVSSFTDAPIPGVVYTLLLYKLLCLTPMGEMATKAVEATFDERLGPISDEMIERFLGGES